MISDFMIHVATKGYCENMFIDLDGTVKPHKFPSNGMWRFDGQVFYLPK